MTTSSPRLLDEIWIHPIPVLLERGKRLFDLWGA